MKRINSCEHGSCYPPTGNLLIGRRSQLRATSTCGLQKPERFCITSEIISHLKKTHKCFYCDASRPNQQHNISNIVGSRNDFERTWWQAENGKKQVSVTLDMEAEFQVNHAIIVFQTFRPAAMLIEHSYDFGKTWHVYRYFAYDCASSFPGIPTHKPKKLNDVICDSRYSNVEPTSDGEIVLR